MPAVPRLMLVTNAARTRESLPALVAAAVAGGVDAVQLRAPELTPAARAELGRALQAVIGERGRLIINGDPALAAALGAGLHLPEAGPDPAPARQRLGPAALIGRSVHAPPPAKATTGVDYLIAGHVFPTVSKPGRPPIGLTGLAAIIAAATVPVLAIGGLTCQNAAAALAVGARGLAVIGAITDAADPVRAAAALRAIIDDAKEPSMSETATESATTASAVTLTINGKPVDVPAGSTITSFITGKGFTAEMVIVELNGAIIPRADYPATALGAGDQLEIVHAVGGG